MELNRAAVASPKALILSRGTITRRMVVHFCLGLEGHPSDNFFQPEGRTLRPGSGNQARNIGVYLSASMCTRTERRRLGMRANSRAVSARP